MKILFIAIFSLSTLYSFSKPEPKTLENDTVIKFEYYPDQTVRLKKIMRKKKDSKQDSSFTLIFIKEELYHKNGNLKAENFFDHRGFCVKAIKYNHKQIKLYEYFFEFKLDLQNLTPNKYESLFSKNYETIWYLDNKIWKKETRVNNERNGPTEIYDKNEKIKRRFYHKDGRKISLEKFKEEERGNIKSVFKN